MNDGAGLEQLSPEFNGVYYFIVCFRSILQTMGTPPLSRSFHSFDLVGDSRVFVLAGKSICPSSSDFYILDLSRDKWTRPLHDGIQDIDLLLHTCELTARIIIEYHVMLYFHHYV